MAKFSGKPKEAQKGGDRRQRNADGAFWSPTRGTYQGLQADTSFLPSDVALYSQYDDLSGANPWDLVDTSNELGTGNLQASSIPKWLRDLGAQVGGVTYSNHGNNAWTTNLYEDNPNSSSPFTRKRLVRPEYYYTAGQLGPKNGDFNNPEGLVDPDSFTRLAWDPRIVIASRTGDWSILNGMTYDVLDRSGNVIGQKVIEGMGKEDGVDQMVGMAAATLATMGAAGALGGGAGAAGGAGGVNAATGVPLSVIPEGAAFVPATGAEVAGMVGGTAGFGVPAGTSVMGAGGFGAGINPATGIGFDVIPQGAAFTPAAGADVAAMIEGAAGFGVPAAAMGAAASGGPGVMPPNPYHPASYLNPTNLGNLAMSTLEGGGWTSLLQPAAQLIGGIMQNDAAGDAADAMAGAATAGIAEQRRQFDTVRELLAPYVQAGNTSLGSYQDLAGANGPDKQHAAIAALQGGPQFGALVRQGEEAILQNASATGGLRGSNTQRSLADYRTEVLSGLIDKQLGRYSPIVNIGQNSAAGVGSAAVNTGNNVANLLGQQGAAQAGGIVAGTNAITDTLGGLGGFFAGQAAGSVPAGGGAPMNLSLPTNGTVPGFGSGTVQGYTMPSRMF